MTYKVIVTDNVHENGIARLRNRTGFQIDVRTGMSHDEFKGIVAGYHAIIIGDTTKVTADIINAGDNLRVIGRAGTDLGNVDVAEATRRGIVVMNTPGGDLIAVAEHAVSLIMAAHRHIPQAVASMKKGKWEKKKFQGREIAGRTLGVIGLGDIGSLTAQYAVRGLKMKVLGYDPVISRETASKSGIKLVSVEEIYSSSDVITIHAPLNRETRGMINAGAFDAMKNGVIIISCGCLELIEEQALFDALESGKVSAACLDDRAENLTQDSRLLAHPSVIATPNLGASTAEAQINVAEAIADQTINYLEKGIIHNAVNAPAIEAGQLVKMAPYMDLAKRLTRFLGQLAGANIIDVEIKYRGEITQWDLKPVTNSALVGLLSGFEGSNVNDVNAAILAGKRGITVRETVLKESSLHGPSLEIRTTAVDGGSMSVQGALIRRIGYEPRIIGIDNFVTEAVPAGPMLIVTNRDVPGMIAGMSGVLAGNGINIGQMNLSRDEIGGKAISIINIDTPADRAVLDSIRGIEGILSVRQIILEQQLFGL